MLQLKKQLSINDGAIDEVAILLLIVKLLMIELLKLDQGPY